MIRITYLNNVKANEPIIFIVLSYSVTVYSIQMDTYHLTYQLIAQNFLLT